MISSAFKYPSRFNFWNLSIPINFPLIFLSLYLSSAYCSQQWFWNLGGTLSSGKETVLRRARTNQFMQALPRPHHQLLLGWESLHIFHRENQMLLLNLHSKLACPPLESIIIAIPAGHRLIDLVFSSHVIYATRT